MEEDFQSAVIDISSNHNEQFNIHKLNGNVRDGFLNELVERIWKEFDGQVTQQQIRDVAAHVAAEFKEARVQIFVPILVHRKTYALLREKLKQET